MYRQAMRGFLSVWVVQGLACLMTSQALRGVVATKDEAIFNTDTEDWVGTMLSPWTQERSVSDQHNHKHASNLCSEPNDPGKVGGGFLKRLAGHQFHSQEGTIDKSELVLVPWLEPFPAIPNPLNHEGKLKRKTAGRDLIGPSKRGWELLDMCQCCYGQQNSPCCQLCQRSRGRITNRYVSKDRKPKPKSNKKHVQNFIQTTMCLCCNRAHVDTCCELCEKVEALWCC